MARRWSWTRRWPPRCRDTSWESSTTRTWRHDCPSGRWRRCGTAWPTLQTQTVPGSRASTACCVACTCRPTLRNWSVSSRSCSVPTAELRSHTWMISQQRSSRTQSATCRTCPRFPCSTRAGSFIFGGALSAPCFPMLQGLSCTGAPSPTTCSLSGLRTPASCKRSDPRGPCGPTTSRRLTSTFAMPSRSGCRWQRAMQRMLLARR
mmetsp:Transcript_90047/g.253946  ORF Transcript_90047/g.253946 Transcript_90047/m.253946 type:complete len:206 (-) Transcript_90047:170-787(-)